ncbi:immunoglobulin i-set domain-containing protein [Ditylenchus destructor]|uniref:Immunoglobulin i-set domain-containing protein n=1 Tax=Ditylenchus destructor TaxID=166010 RepID=A0AAD4N0H5_9BILA|nr:immunoglobulin i-set domain-containing protein [Ditylenchus destructor]
MTTKETYFLDDIVLPGGTSSMSAPAIYGQPKITHDEQSGSVFLECVVTGADSSKTKWFLGDNEIAAGTGAYRFSHSDEGGNRKKFVCEIKNYEKSLQGVYKAVLANSEGKENYATFTVQSGNAPEFYDKPKIVQKDNGSVIQIKARAKSHLEMKVEWFKDDKPVKTSDRLKVVTKPDDKEKDGMQFLLEITGPQKDDQAKYKCVVKNAEGQNQQSLNLVFD